MTNLPRNDNGVAGLLGRKKWVKELIGLPTWFGATMLGMGLTNGRLILVLILMLPLIKIYHLIYEYVFPNYDVKGKRLRIVGFIAAQIIFWTGLFLLWRTAP